MRDTGSCFTSSAIACHFLNRTCYNNKQKEKKGEEENIKHTAKRNQQPKSLCKLTSGCTSVLLYLDFVAVAVAVVVTVVVVVVA